MWAQLRWCYVTDERSAGQSSPSGQRFILVHVLWSHSVPPPQFFTQNVFCSVWSCLYNFSLFSSSSCYLSSFSKHFLLLVHICTSHSRLFMPLWFRRSLLPACWTCEGHFSVGDRGEGRGWYSCSFSQLLLWVSARGRLDGWMIRGGKWKPRNGKDRRYSIPPLSASWWGHSELECACLPLMINCAVMCALKHTATIWFH